MQTNKLILGDNLQIMRAMESESVDLIYLDPPFFSNRNYEVIWGDKGEVRSFEDRWSGGIEHYISWLKERVVEMHRLLKPTGSIFLHCDWHADAYIRVEILDKIFGTDNFLNHIIWKRTFTHSDTKKKLAMLSDTIWYYSKSDKNTYTPIYIASNEKYIANFYKHNDNDGKGFYQLVAFTQAGQGPARRFGDVTLEPPKGKHWIWTQEKIDEGMKTGVIVYKENKMPRVKRYLNDIKGQLLSNIWDDIRNVQSQSLERIGYPTQKPETLLERIIKMSTNEGDIILDPFVGGGTTVAVAERLGRKWIGIDQSVAAIKVTEMRLDKRRNLLSAPFSVQLHKYDYDTLRNKDAFEFETWIISQFGGIPQNKKGSDFGLDGKTKDNTPIQVKRSDNIGHPVVDNFLSAVKRYDKNLFDRNVAAGKEVGFIIAFSFARNAIEEVARLRNSENTVIKLVKVEDLVELSKKPALSVEINEISRDDKGVCEIEFIAAAKSDSGIEFYSWDFDYDVEKGFRAALMLDKSGRQTKILAAGLHNIAVKVVDNDGLENIEIVKLKINGVVEKI